MIPNKKSAISFINQHGALLAYPVKNKDNVPSIWKCFFPKTPMRWEWSEDGDDRVALIWHLRAELSNSNKVVYTKWFSGRATFISFKLFTALLKHVSSLENPLKNLSPEALNVYRVLEDDSPLPTKILRLESSLEGKSNEGKFNKAQRELWARLLIVGYGEVEEGGFPSLAVGASKLLFEELWDNSLLMSESEQNAIIDKFLPEGSAFHSHYTKWLKGIEKYK